MKDIPLVLLAGPTAVGKTAASLELAKALNGEIISGDSMQVFRGFDIGTAKIKPEEMAGIKHHLIDILAPDATFSAAEFQALADEKIAEIAGRGHVPILVGGTGFYINSVLYAYHFAQAGEDSGYREALRDILEKQGPEALLRQLEAVDPQSAARLHLHDTKRIMRALEVYHVTGRPMSEAAAGVDKHIPRYKMVYQALNLDRQKLYERIDQRVEAMLAQGWLDEVQKLLAAGVPKDCQAMQGLGYRQLVAYLEGAESWERTVEVIKRDTRHFAKRQLTWFRHDPHLLWVNKDQKSDADIFQELLQNICREIGLCVE